MVQAKYQVCKIDPENRDRPSQEIPWAQANELQIAHYRPEGSDHRPTTRVRMLHDGRNLYLRFCVQDRYVRAVRETPGELVCRDSCVEFFVQPRQDKGYFNFEMNCGGTLLVFYVQDARRVGPVMAKYTDISRELAAAVQIEHSLPKRVDPEITQPVPWTLSCIIPLAALEPYIGAPGALSGQHWRGNFYKCGDETSHPHWASWNPVDELNFHLPRCFGELVFE